MPRKTMVEAIRDAIDVSMQRDDNVVVFGEDVGYFGGVFRTTQGLQQKFGSNRCFDTPISESGIVGAAVGMAKIVFFVALVLFLISLVFGFSRGSLRW